MPEIVEQLTLPLFETAATAPGTGTPSEQLPFNEIIQAENIRGISVVLSRTLRRSWHVRRAPFTRRLTLTVPASFARLPAETKRSLIRWADLAFKSRRNHDARHERRRIERAIIAQTSGAGAAPLNPSRIDPRRFNKNTRGTFHDLREIFDRVNHASFGGAVVSCVRWGGYATTTSYQSTKKDLSDAPFSLITIAGVYDHPAVPRFAIEAVMRHEMLHVVMPPSVKNGRRSVHPRAFTAAEQAFPGFQEWHSWEKTWLHRLAREMRRKRRAHHPARALGD
jgi:hypothetical protein